MITYRPSGRLGNQLQLYACARTLSLRYGFDFLYQPIVHARQLNFAYGVSEQVRTQVCRWSRKRVLLNDHGWDASHNRDGRMTPDFIDRSNVLYVLERGGIFKDIREHRSILIDEIVPTERRARPGALPPHHVAMHVRAGDTLYPLPYSYYVSAVARAREYLGREPVLHLFSDHGHADIARKLRALLPTTEIHIHAGSATDDLLGLANYAAIILSISWFSYWAAFLSDAQYVFAPANFCYYPDWIAVPAN